MKISFRLTSCLSWEYRKLFLAAFLILLPFGLFAQTPFAHYPLNGNANDVGSNGINGTIVGTVSPIADRNGNANGAMQFGGGNVQLGGSFADQNFSISLWLKPGSSQVQFADIVDNNHTNFQNWVLQQDASTLNRYVFGVHRSSGGIGVFFNLQADVWQHLVLVKSATTVDAYINGVLNQTTAWDGTVNYVSPFFRLGNWPGNDRQWNGGMDEVKYFNTALNQSQVTALFNENSGSQPIAYYSFTGNANDETGTNEGSVNGATLTTDRFGNANSAYSFDGVDDLIDIPTNDAIPSSGPVSVSAWINFTAGGGNLNWFKKGTSNGYGLYVQNGTIFVITFDVLNWNTGVTLSPDQWHQIVFTFDGTTQRIYKNGVLAASLTAGYMPASGSAHIGRNFTGFEQGFFRGKIDEIKVYNTALSAAQIQDDFTEAGSGPIAYYPFTGNANDVVGSLNGTVNGATLTTDRFGNANSAYSFDGVDDFISTSNLALTQATNWSMSAWVKAAGLVNHGLVVENGNDDAVNACGGYSMGKQSGNLMGYHGCVANISSNTAFPAANQWAHIAMVNSEGTTKFYVNGVLAPGTSNSTPNAPGGSLKIGSGTGIRFFDGAIDEVKIYNMGLTAAQVQAEFNGSSAGAQQKPGSGNALSFDGVDDVIIAPTTGYTGIQSYTVECWVKKNNLVSEEHIWESTTMSSPSLESNGENGYNFWVDNSSPLSTGPLNVGQWYHIACVYNQVAGLQQVFVNGISKSSSFIGVSDAFGPSVSIGARSAQAPFRNFNGSLDEFRVWNTALTQTQIRDRMCRKITSGDALFSNLVAYYNFDESTGNSAFDGTSNNNTGTLTNGPTRVTSGAAIGNTSAHGYVTTGFPNATLTFNGQDNLFVNYVAGSFSGTAGTHVYVVNEKPNTETGIENPGTNDRYFGVFSAGMTNPTYNATYNYTGNPFVTAGNESQLALYKRTDNAASSWGNASATLNTAANTLSATGQSTEYALGATTPNLAQQKPGSGNALSFDGVDDEVQSAQIQFPPNSFVMEAWVKPNSTTTLHPQATSGAFGQFGSNQFVVFPTHGNALGSGSSNAGAGFSVGTNGICVFEHGDSYIPVLLSWAGEVTGWTHVAVVYTNKQPSLYVNGILVATGLTSGRANVFASSHQIGGGAYGHFNGELDEYRIWNTALTQTQIRDRMCRKITSGDALFSNLVAYYNFDESTGNSAFDGTSNNNTGTLTNGPTRVTSGAHIGNTSSHNYVSSGFPAANLTFNGQDNLGVNYTAGTFSGEAGTHVYVVNEKPNTETGIENPGTNDRYFGVFSAGMTNPTYNATYNYTSNPFVTAGNENQLTLFKRTDNAATSWGNASATLNTTTNTLTASGQSTEYVLGVGACVPPPVPTITSGGQTSFCENESMSLLSSAATGNQWSRNGSDIPGATSNTLTATLAGTYAVRVTVGSCSSTSADLVLTTKPIPTVSISASAPALCEGAAVTLSTTGTALSGREWLLNGATTNQFGTTFSASSSGNYSVIGTAANGCKNTSAALNIQADATPVLSSNKPANTMCSGTSIILTSTPGASFLWSNAATTSSITVSPSIDTEFSVRTTGALGCVYNDTIQVIVVPSLTPAAVTNMLPENGSINQENSIEFSWQPAANALAYDLFVWPTGQARPASPKTTVTGGISATLFNLPFGTQHNYQVVSRSACLSTDGPVQTFTTRNLPDLVVSNVQSQTSIGTPGTLTVTYTVTNTGTGVSLPGSWKDKLFLSVDSVLGNNDLLSTKSNVNALAPGASYNGSFQVETSVVGSRFVYVQTDGNSEVIETNESNNLIFRNPGQVTFIQAQPSADLVGVGEAFTPSSAIGGQMVSVSYRVLNQGDKIASGTRPFFGCTPNNNCPNDVDLAWEDNLYISPSPVFDGQARFIGRLQNNPRYNRFRSERVCGVCNSYYTHETFLPIDSSMVVSSISAPSIPHDYSGIAFYHIRMNEGGQGGLQEIITQNNGMVSNQFNVILRPPADLEVSNVTVTPSSSQQGNQVKVKYRVTNIGANSPKSSELPFMDKVYLSTSSVLNKATALVVYTHNFAAGSFESNQFYSDSVTFQVPFLSTTPLFVFVETDAGNSVFEHTFKANNTSAGVQLILDLNKKPDYVSSAVTSVSTVQSGAQLAVSYTVSNTGNATGVGEIGLSYYLKPIGTSGLGTPIVGSPFSPLAPGGSTPVSISLSIPNGLAPGSYVLSVVVDEANLQPELNEANNTVTKTITVTAGAAYNLVLTNLTHPATVDIFQNQPSFQVSGQASYSLVQDGPGIPTTIAGVIEVRQAAGGSVLYTKDFTLSFPSGIPATFAIPAQTIQRNTVPEGNYEVVMKLSTASFSIETNLTDNTLTQSIFFTPSPKPDVVFQSAPTSLSLASGTSFSIPLQIKNTGVNELTGKVVSRAYLSNSPSTTNISGNILGSSFSIPGITSMPTNAVIKDTIRGFIPLSVAGNYFLQIELEADRNTWEGTAGEANNIITIPLAVSAPQLPDLRPDALSLPTNIEAGRTLSFNYVMRNIGAGSFSGTPKNTFRVSKLGIFNPSTDGETGIDQSFISLNAGANTTLPGKMVVSGLKPGAYKPGVFANSNFAALESNFTNNEVYTAATRNVFINPLNLDVTASENNFSGDYFYRSVMVGNGLDILAEFEGEEAYASKDKVPTASVSEFASAEDGTKQLIIPNSEAGQYFFGVVPNTTGTTSLKVRALPFSIISLSPNKVGQGNATAEIKGAAFTQATLFLLLNGGGAVVDTGTVRILRNSMQARVTFHCQNIPVGFYTVRAIKPNLDTFDLANGLQVQPKSSTGIVASSNMPTTLAATSTVPVVYTFTNAGNVDLENALARVSLPDFARIKNVVISPNAIGLEAFNDQTGVWGLDKKVQYELIDFVNYIPAWKRNMASGESFSIGFELDKFGAADEMYTTLYGAEMPDEQLYQVVTNQIEKLRALHIQKAAQIQDQSLLDSLGGYWSYKRLAMENLFSAGFFRQDERAAINGFDYFPSLYQPNSMHGFGIIPDIRQPIALSKSLLCYGPKEEYNFPTDSALYFDYDQGAFVVYSSNFRRTAEDLIATACNGDVAEFTRRLNRSPAGGRLIGSQADGFVYGPAIYANIFGLYDEGTGLRPGKGNQHHTQEGSGWLGGDLGFNNQRDLFNKPPDRTPPPPPPPTKPANKPFDPITNFGDPGPLPHKNPSPECDAIAIPACEVTIKKPAKTRCNEKYRVHIIRACHIKGDGLSSFCFPTTPFFESNVYYLKYSCDPNEIVGPEGVGTSKFVARKDSAEYTILFENDPEFAEAAASTVRIIQPLDSNFQENSVKMESFGFDNREFPLENEGNSFSTQIDLSTDRGILVNVLGTLDIVNKQLFWQCTTVDAATGQPSVDPEKGFLPVNDSTGKGEGYVRYKILPGFGTQTGDSLRAQAEIFFDFNEPIKTNRHWNVVDALPPTTSISTASGTQADTIVNLAWTVADDEGGSDADSTFILVQKDGGAIEPLAGFQADTGQVEIPDFENGHSYGFYFRSRDLVGNLEELPAEPQVTITIGEPCNVPTPTLIALGPVTFCSGDSVVLKSGVSDGNLWSTGATSQSIVVYESSTVTLKTVIGSCTSATSQPLVIVVNPLPAKPVLTPNGPTTFCQGGSVSITTNAAAGHRWSTGSTLSSITLNTSQTVADTAKALGCKTVSDPVTVTVNPLPVVNAGLDVSIEAGQSTNLTATGASTYLWSPLQFITPGNGVGATVSVNPIQTLEYTVTGTDANNCSASDMVRVSVTGGSGPLTAPTISPGTGTFAVPQMVTITSTSPGAEIYFTTTGNSPVVGTSFTKLYTAPFQVLKTSTIRAMAVKAGQANSAVAVSFLTISNAGIVETPVINPAGGTFEGFVSVTLTDATPEAQIFFTTNGNMPVIGSSFTKLYAAPFLLYANTTVRAMAIRGGLVNSAVATANFVVNNPAIVATPTFSPLPGNFGGPQSITLSTTTPSTQIYFTTNGNVPRLDVPNSFTKLYTGPFLLNQTATIRAIAVRNNWQQSGTAVGIYTFGGARGAVAELETETMEEKEIAVFPNPSASGIFYLILPENDGEAMEYSVLSVEGKTIETGTAKPGDHPTLDLSHQPAGLYHLKIRLGNRFEIRRLSKL